MIEVCFFFLTDAESLCGSRFQVDGGLVRLEPGRNRKPGAEAFYFGAACHSDLTSHHIYSFYRFIFFSQFCTFACTERAGLILFFCPLRGEGLALGRLYITVRWVNPLKRFHESQLKVDSSANFAAKTEFPL